MTEERRRRGERGRSERRSSLLLYLRKTAGEKERQRKREKEKRLER